MQLTIFINLGALIEASLLDTDVQLYYLVLVNVYASIAVLFYLLEASLTAKCCSTQPTLPERTSQPLPESYFLTYFASLVYSKERMVSCVAFEFRAIRKKGGKAAVDSYKACRRQHHRSSRLKNEKVSIKCQR